MSMRRALTLLLCLSALTGCASSRRAALHLDPERAFAAALARHRGFSPVPSSTVAASLRAPVLLLPFADRTVVPTGTYLDDRDNTPISEVYLVPDLVPHLEDQVASALASGGVSVYRAYDDASAADAASIIGERPRTLEVSVDAFELHRWYRDRPIEAGESGQQVDVVRVAYRYRWGDGGPAAPAFRRSVHELLIPPRSDPLAVVGRYIVREIAAHLD